MQWDIGVDMGETGVRLATRQKGIVLCSPSYGALRSGEVIAIGEEAFAMLGRTPANVRVEKPVSGGAVANPRLAALWVSQLLAPFVSAARFSRPRLLFSDSGFFSLSEKELLSAAAIEAGAQAADWTSADLLTARGAGLDILKPKGKMCVSVGAGVMSAALISFGRVVHAERLSWGAQRIDRDIIHLVRSKAALAIGEKTAEQIKMAIASASSARELKTHTVGLDLRSGFPVEKEITSSMIRPAVEPLISALTMLILCCAEQAGAELCADLLEEGVTLAGGGALLSGLDRTLSEKTGLRCRVCEAPEMAAINGMAAFLQEV